MELNKVTESNSTISTPTIGIAGEVRCVITKADGSIKTDTGYFKNLILNQGLDFFGRGKGNRINESCVIGSGNSTPVVTQTHLDAFIATATGTDKTLDYSYTDTGDGFYRTWEQQKYRFTSEVPINISEIGLVSQGTGSGDYYLTTRVLPKDSLGAPVSLSLRVGEVLDIYYKIHKVVDTRDKAFVINVLDGSGGAVPYNALIRLAGVGTSSFDNISQYIFAPRWGVYFGTSDISAKETQPSLSSLNDIVTVSAYTANSTKVKMTINFGLNQANINIRTIGFYTEMLPIQMRLGRVSDDAALNKTNKDTLEIPLEFSWGRYEGAL